GFCRSLNRRTFSRCRHTSEQYFLLGRASSGSGSWQDLQRRRSSWFMLIVRWNWHLRVSKGGYRNVTTVHFSARGVVEILGDLEVRSSGCIHVRFPSVSF